MSEEKLLKIAEAAEYVGLSILTVRRLVRKGILPAAKIGRAYRFKRADIDSYLREQYVKGESNE